MIRQSRKGRNLIRELADGQKDAAVIEKTRGKDQKASTGERMKTPNTIW
jgi:hypothetical protein